MFKFLVLVLVSFCFSLSLVKEANTSSCYYRLDGSSWVNKDTTFNYMDADNVAKSIQVKWGEIKLVPYLNGSVPRGQLYMYGHAFDARQTLYRVSFYVKWWQTRNYSITYTTVNQYGANVAITCTTSTNKLFNLTGIVSGTTISATLGTDTYISTPITSEGVTLWFTSTLGPVNQTPAAYFYIKNSLSSSQTVSYTAITGRDTTIVCPANTVTEVTYGANNTSVWIGTVRYDGVQLGDKIVISPLDAVETVQANKLNPLTVYPNPSSGTLNISLSNKSDIKVYTLDGKLILSYRNVNTVKTDALLNGVYIISAKQGGVEMKRMVNVIR